METRRIVHKLAAIAFLDVAGYSRLMEQNEAGTHARLKQILADVVAPSVARHGGRIVDTAGDGALMEFASATGALRCAFEIQQTLQTQNHACPPHERMDLRIGINLGDIIVDGDRIAGDGVNVAARLQALAEPGQICVSSAIRDHARDEAGLGFVDIGEQQVKNIKRPIHAYRVVPRDGASRLDLKGARPPAHWLVQWRRLGIGGAALAVVVTATWFASPFWAQIPTEKRSTAPLMSIAILTFTAASADARDEAFADGLSAEITLSLGRSRWARVVARSVAARYSAMVSDPRVVGRELNVRYLAEGEIRRIGEQLSINIQMIDCDDGTQTWADRLQYSGTEADARQKDIAGQITLRLRDALVAAERRRARSPPATGASAMDYVVYADAVWSMDPNSVSGARKARNLYDVAISLDPGLVPALLGRVRTLWYEFDIDPPADRSRVLQEMDDLTTRAVAVDPIDSRAWTYRAGALAREARWDAAFEANAKAESLDPTRANTIIQRAQLMVYVGQPEEALKLVDRALSLDPRDPQDLGFAMMQRCVALMALGHYADAIVACQRSAALDDWWLPHLYLAAAYALTGDRPAAAVERAAVQRNRPDLSIATVKKLGKSNHPLYVRQTEDSLILGLRRAGFPDE